MKKNYLTVAALAVAASTVLTGCFWEGPLYPEEAAKAKAAAEAAATETEEATEVETSFFLDREMECPNLKLGDTIDGKCTGALYYSTGSVSENYEFDENASSAKLKVTSLSSSTVGISTTYRITVTADLVYVFNQTKSDWYTVTPGVGFTPLFLMDYYTGNVFPSRNMSAEDSYEEAVTIDWKEDSYDISYEQGIEWGELTVDDGTSDTSTTGTSTTGTSDTSTTGTSTTGTTSNTNYIDTIKYVGTATCTYTIKVPKAYDGLVFAYDMSEKKSDKNTDDSDTSDSSSAETGTLTTDSNYSLTSLHGIMDGLENNDQLKNYKFWRVK